MPSLVVVIALLVVSLLGGGTAYASQDALPGEILYGVKMLVEEVRLLIETDEIAAAQLHLEYASTRLEEAAALVAQGRPDLVEGVLARYAEQMEAALTPLADGVGEDEMDLLDRLSEALAHHQAVLTEVLDQVPDEAKPAIERAMAVSDVAAQVLAAVGRDVTPVLPTGVPPAIEPPIIEPPAVVSPTIELPSIEPPAMVPPTIEPAAVVSPTIVPPTVVPPTIVPPTVAPPTIVVPTFEPPAVVPPDIQRPLGEPEAAGGRPGG